jgi:hypothetical protein
MQHQHNKQMINAGSCAAGTCSMIEAGSICSINVVVTQAINMAVAAVLNDAAWARHMLLCELPGWLTGSWCRMQCVLVLWLVVGAAI